MSLSFLCGLFGYTRQAYYKHLRRNREGSLSDTLLLERVGYYRKLMPRLGGRKLWHLLQQDGFPVSRDRLFTLLSENNLLVKRRKKYSVTTCSRHWMRKYPNLIRGFDEPRSNNDCNHSMRLFVPCVRNLIKVFRHTYYLSVLFRRITNIYAIKSFTALFLFRSAVTIEISEEQTCSLPILAIDTVAYFRRFSRSLNQSNLF